MMWCDGLWVAILLFPNHPFSYPLVLPLKCISVPESLYRSVCVCVAARGLMGRPVFG